MKKYILGYWFPLIAYMSLIFYLSSLPQESFTGLSEGFHLNDKIEHFLEYSLLSILFLRVLKYHSRKNPSLKAVAFSTLYGLTDEIHQFFVPTRVFSFNDLFYDFLGSLVSVALLLVFKKVISARKK